jgi:hypothetical protein
LHGLARDRAAGRPAKELFQGLEIGLLVGGERTTLWTSIFAHSPRSTAAALPCHLYFQRTLARQHFVDPLQYLVLRLKLREAGNELRNADEAATRPFTTAVLFSELATEGARTRSN